MVDNIVLPTSFLMSILRKKIENSMGAEGIVALVDLMVTARVNELITPLFDYDIDDIELAANWEGRGGHREFVDGLINLEVIVKVDGIYTLDLRG